MKLSVASLGTLYEMAHEGAQLAANRLSRMTDVPTRVGVTRVDFVDRDAIAREFDDGTRRAAVQVDLDGGLGGSSLIVFDADSAREVVDTLVEQVPHETTEEFRASAMLEVGQIMNSGFVDGWANVLDREVDVGYPQFISGDDPEAFLANVDLAAPAETDLALLFGSRVSAVGTDLGFDHYLFPTPETLEGLFDAHRTAAGGIEYTKLAGFDRMADRGAETVADHLSKFTGLDAGVRVRRINFVSLHAIPNAVPREELVSVAFSFEGVIDGYLLFLFDLESAREVATATVGDGETPGDDQDETPEQGLDAFSRDAIQELGNIMASGLLDGWANMLDATITHSTPAFARDMGAAVIDPLVVELSPTQEFAFVFDTEIEARGTTLDVDIYAVPDEADLERALQALEEDRVEDTPVTAEFARREDDDLDGVEELDAEELTQLGDAT